MADGSPVERARPALDRHSWREAFDLLSAEDEAGALAPADLGLLAEAAWRVGKLPLAIEVRERAYALAIRQHDYETAVGFAVCSLGTTSSATPTPDALALAPSGRPG